MRLSTITAFVRRIRGCVRHREGWSISTTSPLQQRLACICLWLYHSVVDSHLVDQVGPAGVRGDAVAGTAVEAAGAVCQFTLCVFGYQDIVHGKFAAGVAPREAHAVPRVGTHLASIWLPPQERCVVHPAWLRCSEHRSSLRMFLIQSNHSLLPPEHKRPDHFPPVTPVSHTP